MRFVKYSRQILCVHCFYRVSEAGRTSVPSLKWIRPKAFYPRGK